MNEIADDFEVKAVELLPLGWCLMLKTASDALDLIMLQRQEDEKYKN